MQYVFFGTPKFASRVLEKLVEAGNPPSVLVCNPDRPVGRKKTVTPPPTKRLIETRDKRQETRIFQPESKEELTELSDEIFKDCDFGVVAAYAQIIPREVIDKARLGIIGVHPSLLPRLRGATPIQTAILEGYEKTGTTLFILDEKVDHGPILASRDLGVGDSDYTSLEERLADISGELLLETLPKFVTGKIEPEVQDESLATYTKKFSLEDAYISPKDLKKAEETGENAVEILRKIRALNPEPGAYTELDGKRTKLLEAEIEDGRLVLKEIQKEGGTPTRV